MKIYEKIPLVTAFVGYALFLAAVYLMAFWGSFGINVFEFANISDFAKLAIYPVALIVGGFLTGFLVQLANLALFDFKSSTVQRSGFIKWVSENWNLIAIFGVFGVFVCLQAVGGMLGWMLAAPCILPFAIALADRAPIQSYVPSSVHRRWLLMFLAILPFLVVARGLENAGLIKDGKGRMIVEKVGVASSLAAVDEKPLFYVGFVGGTFVIYETLTKNIVLAKQSDSTILFLKERQSK